MKSLEKRAELSVLLDSAEYDILAVTETWANDTLTDAMLISDPGSCHKFPYSVFRKDRTNREGGGVCVWVNNRYSVIALELLDCEKELETVALDLVGSHSKQRFVCVYRTGQCKEYATVLRNYLNRICDVPYPVVVVGDFNLPNIDFSSFNCPSDGIHDVLLDCFLENNMTQLVENATRGENILDLVLCSDKNLIQNVSVEEPFSDSDHSTVIFSMIENSDKSYCDEEYYDFKSADYDGICNFLGNIMWDREFEGCTTVESYANLIYSALESAIFVYVPRRKRSIAKSKLPRKLRKLRAKKKKAWKNRKLTANGRMLFRKASDDFKSELTEFVKNKEAQIISDGDIRNFYRFASSKLNYNRAIAALKDSDGKIVTDKLKQANLLNDYFCSVFTHDNGILPDFEKRVPDNSALGDIEFSVGKVGRALRKLPNKCSRSPDNVPALFLKLIALKNEDCISRPLCTLFNVSMYNGAVPSIWNTAVVSAVHKKGDVSSCANYRPVSLTCILCKVMERLVKEKIMDYLLANRLITKHQHGFLSKKSVTSQLLECVNVWSNGVANRKSIDVIYLDYQKAFDTVSHEKLLYKLEKYGIRDKVLNWIRAFLSNRTQAVCIDGVFSSISQVLSGVPQGSVLGPILFLLYVNDVIDKIPDKVEIKLFADDVKIFAEVNNDLNVPSSLSTGLACVKQWSDLWQLGLASTKCVSLSIGVNNPARTYMIENVLLEKVLSFRDLGITISNTLKSAEHCKKISAKAMQRCGLLFRAFSSCDKELLVRAYCTYVRPILESCSPVWSPYLVKDIKTIERVQRYFSRRVALRCGFTRECMEYEERCKWLNLQSLEERRLIADLVLCFKIVHKKIEVVHDNWIMKCENKMTRNNGHKLSVQRCNSTLGMSFFGNRIVNPWNFIDRNYPLVSATTSVTRFKSQLSTCDLTNFLSCYKFN